MGYQIVVARSPDLATGAPVVARSPDLATGADRRSPEPGQEETFGQGSGRVGRPCHNGESSAFICVHLRFLSSWEKGMTNPTTPPARPEPLLRTLAPALRAVERDLRK